MTRSIDRRRLTGGGTDKIFLEAVFQSLNYSKCRPLISVTMDETISPGFRRRFLSTFFRKPPSCIALCPIGFWLTVLQGSAFPWWLLPLFIHQKQCSQAASYCVASKSPPAGSSSHRFILRPEP
jgi:hypothetical protein